MVPICSGHLIVLDMPDAFKTCKQNILSQVVISQRLFIVSQTLVRVTRVDDAHDVHVDCLEELLGKPIHLVIKLRELSSLDDVHDHEDAIVDLNVTLHRELEGIFILPLREQGIGQVVEGHGNILLDPALKLRVPELLLHSLHVDDLFKQMLVCYVDSLLEIDDTLRGLLEASETPCHVYQSLKVETRLH